MKFKKEDLQNLVYDESDVLEKVRDKQVDSGRWTIDYELVFKFEDHYYQTNYSVGATEQQDVTAFEYDKDLIECTEVWPESQSVIVFTDQDPGYTEEGRARMELLI